MRRALRVALRAADTLVAMPPAHAAAAPPASRVPTAVALAAARALSGAAAGSSGSSGSGAVPPPVQPLVNAPSPDTLAAAGAKRKELYMVFTCGRCETRAVKGFSRQAYEHGVVLVDCPGCQARHLIADRKGWFGDKGGVEDFLAERGEAVVRRGGAGEDALEISAEELAGWRKRDDS